MGSPSKTPPPPSRELRDLEKKEQADAIFEFSKPSLWIRIVDRGNSFSTLIGSKTRFRICTQETEHDYKARRFHYVATVEEALSHVMFELKMTYGALRAAMLKAIFNDDFERARTLARNTEIQSDTNPELYIFSSRELSKFSNRTRVRFGLPTDLL